GLLLFKIGDLSSKGYKMIRDENDKRIISKLIKYLGSIEYWQDSDNGIWEENEEVHASSVGACVAGLIAVKNIVEVPEEIIQKGKDTLNFLLPHESATKEVDLALLSLIYPLKVVSEKQARQILNNVETKLLRRKGIIRYVGDRYYKKNNKEAEWCFGLPWLAIIYKELGDDMKHAEFLLKTLEAMTPEGEIPELYYGETDEYNENTPLGWGQAMFLQAMLL
ncbi:MAG: glycoside hydrolase family 15, partial [Nanoarchaeota archaeon]|nr:glycoside hydrolase family 15 [Nanoarchaeota archaeon]